MAILRYLDDTGHLQSKSLDSGQFVIGRAPTCSLAFDSDMISREHLRIDIEPDGRFRLRDLESRNKTHVNGELVAETVLSSGDIIRAGDRVMEFIDDAVAVAPLDTSFLSNDRTEPANVEWAPPKQPAPLTAPQLEQLARIAGDQPIMARAEDVAELALTEIMLELQAERGFIALRASNKEELLPIAHRAMHRSPGGGRVLVNRAFALAPLLSQTGGRYPTTVAQLAAKVGYATAAVVAPLTHGGQTIGVLYVDRPSAKKPFAPEAMNHAIGIGAFLGGLIGEVTRRLTSFSPRDGLAWMSGMRRVQRALGASMHSDETLEVLSRTHHGRARCGDLFDCVKVSDRRYLLTLADGGGHGFTGIAQAHAMRVAIRTATCAAEELFNDPAPLLGQLNQAVAASPSRQNIPLTYLAIDLADGQLTYVNAGGPTPVMLVGPGQTLELQQTCLMLGVDPAHRFEPARAALPPVFRIALFSHGLIDSVNAGGEVYGPHRLAEALMDRDAFTTPSTLLSKIAQSWNGHMAGSTPDDDVVYAVAGCG